jgi:hypothetical protein
MRIPILLALVALALAGCNANQGPSGQAGALRERSRLQSVQSLELRANNVGIGR